MIKEFEALSTRAMKKLIEKQRIIQEQEKLIKEKEKESSTDAHILSLSMHFHTGNVYYDAVLTILVSIFPLVKKEQSHAEIEQ